MSFPLVPPNSLTSYPPPPNIPILPIAGAHLPPGLSHYNPQTVNIAKMAEQLQKRKLLWGDKPKKPSQSEDQQHVQSEASNSNSSCSSSGGQSSSVWSSIQFGGDKGAQMTEKFRKLMGIKDSSAQSSTSVSKEDPSQSLNEQSAPDEANPLKNQQKLFDQLDDQYSRARMATHTQRGVGLGFNSYH